MNENLSIKDLSYSDRQLIVVTEDNIDRAAREAEHKVTIEKQGINWIKIADVALSSVFLFSIIEELTKEAIKAWGRARASGMRILPIGKSEAATIIFPPGHPRESVLYIGHPAIPNVYYTTSDFHRITFEHKFSEAITLLMYLGANKIRVEHVKGWSKYFSSKISVPLGLASENISAETKMDNKSHSQFLYEAILSGSDNPSIPDGLVWYPHETTWQAISKGLISFGLQNFF
ncbi:MAG: hypothetical protein BWK80_35905 [Desulfobacteraceae bacterium IS3]|nr:MAG: hypothetical protein BWK80_35905 [Desulfobacteraceae bacterium IS3]